MHSRLGKNFPKKIWESKEQKGCKKIAEHSMAWWGGWRLSWERHLSSTGSAMPSIPSSTKYTHFHRVYPVPPVKVQLIPTSTEYIPSPTKYTQFQRFYYRLYPVPKDFITGYTKLQKVSIPGIPSSRKIHILTGYTIYSDSSFFWIHPTITEALIKLKIFI